MTLLTISQQTGLKANMALGTGGIKPCVSSYGADQFDDADEVEKKHKSSFFNWFYLSINVGALIASTLLVWIQDNVGWGSADRTKRIKKQTQVRVLVDKSSLYETTDIKSAIVGSRKLDHTEDLSFLDKAAMELQSDHVKGSADPWRLCTVTQVEELKSIIKLLPVWATGIIFSAVYSQMSNLFVLQGSFMDITINNFEIPPASLSVFDTLSVIFWCLVYDRVLVPVARKYTGHKSGITVLQRMGTGLAISIFAMLAAGILEVIRLGIVKRNNYYDLENMPMSIFWQVPQYFLIGCAEVFTMVGQIEFFYDQAPDSMRSLCSALALTTNSLGNYLSSLLVTIVMGITTKGGKAGWIPDNLNHGQLQNFFWLLTVLSVINLGAFLLVAKRYTYKKTAGTLR
ncbi:NRT1/ PTR family 8.2-like protein [Tanacetum coccineum]